MQEGKMEDKSKDLARMKELNELLNRASRAYYMQDTEIMSNCEYDALDDELKDLEERTGTVLSGSPTVRVGYEVVSELPKEEHEFPMLSLDKTKEVGQLVSWLGDQKAVLSWKMDGLTIVLTYEGGELIKAVTRGNGHVGEIVTGNAKVFQNVPHRISFKGKLVLRGEAVIRYSDFNEINEKLPEGEARYKNPRNLCSGSVRQLNSQVTASRNVYLYAFALVYAQGADIENSAMARFDWLSSQGFDVVEHRLVDADTLPAAVEDFAARIQDNDFPSDGLVLLLEDIAYGQSLGTTAKFPRNAIAFKWADEVEETHLRSVEWSASRTGLINPVAIFDPVELEGTTVTRASLHNVSIVKALQLGLGDRLQVYKANMIIPQIAENLTRSDTLEIPDTCPVCGAHTTLRDENGVMTLYCTNPACLAKHSGLLVHFTSRDAFNIEGLSEATLEKFIQKGFIHEFSDIFHLDRYKEEIVAMEGFGEKSYAKLAQAIEKARNISLPRLIYSLGIPGIGLSNAGLLCRHFGGDLGRLLAADQEDLIKVQGIGSVMAGSFVSYFQDEENRKAFDRLLGEIQIEQMPQADQDRLLEGKTFVITGSLNHFANRKALKDMIEELGGRAAGSVSSKTSYLINNDSASSSAKNQKAAQLGIPIITEDEFLEMIGHLS